MKKCSNPNCASSFLFGDNKTNCPFCHGPLERCNGASHEQHRITPPNMALRNTERELSPPLAARRMGRTEYTGRITEIEHQTIFHSRFHKLMNTVVRGEPFQLAHQSAEYTIRIEPITDGVPSEVTDICLYGNYLGRLQVGDEVKVKVKDCGHRRVAKSIVNLTTGSVVRPGLQVSAGLVRGLLLAAVLMIAVLICMIVQLFSSGTVGSFFGVLLSALIPAAICIFGFWLLFRSLFGRRSRKERRRW